MDQAQRKGEKTKQFIAEQAKALFEQKGYAATSMEDIRSATDMSKGSIYYHFKSKEDLYLFTVEEANKAWIRNWHEQTRAAVTATEKLYQLARCYATDMHSSLAQTVPEYIASENVQGQKQEKLADLIEPEYDVCRRVIEEGIERGEWNPDQPATELAFILYSTLTGLSITQFLGHDVDQFYRFYDSAIAVFLQGIAKP